METQNKSTVQFQLKPKANSPSLKLLRACIFNAMPKDYGTTDVVRVQILQQVYRNQFYRAITATPEKRRPYTYGLNCPPCGFNAQPKTKTCKNPKICPWCFVRLRLIKTYRALLEVPANSRKGHQLIVWRRIVSDNGKLPFLRANYGPHTWCKALVTVQIVVPFVNEHASQGQTKIQLCHAGVQVVPNNCNFKKELDRYCIRPMLTSKSFGEVNPDNVVKALAESLRLEWMALYRPYNLESFQSLIHGFKNSQLIRISSFKAEKVDAVD